MSVRYLDLVDYVAIAAEVTGLEVETLMSVGKLDLADSALHAPAAGFGEVEFYPDFAVKAAVLVVRLAKNHPLPDGNKRAAWVSLRMFVELNGWSWHIQPSVDEAEHAVLAIASGDWNEQDMTAWLRARIAAALSNDPRAREAALAGPAQRDPSADASGRQRKA